MSSVQTQTFEERTGRDKYFEALEKELLALLDPETGLLDQRFARYVNCAICGSDHADELFIKRGFRFVQCTSCGHVYTNPQVVEEKVLDAYAESNANDYWLDVLLSSENRSWQIPYFEEVLDIAEKHVERGRVLDIGCSVGLFLEVAENRGWEGVGLELNDKAVEYARGRGLTVQQALLSDADLEPESFDLVTAFSLMEHVHDPRQLLAEARTLLNPAGIFAAISPNTYSLASMILREKMPTFDGRNHLQYYSLDTFRRLFEESGFRVVHLDTVLTALPNIRRYISYRDPHGKCNGHLPQTVAAFFEGEGQEKLEAFMEENDMGLRLRLVAQKS